MPETALAQARAKVLGQDAAPVAPGGSATEPPDAERPADAPLALVRGRRRKRLLVRADRDVDLQGFLRAWLARVKVPASVRLNVDVDPYSFL